MKLRILTAGLLLTGTLFGAYGFADGVALQQSHPEFFVPGHVSVVTNGGVAYYVFSGRALRTSQSKTGICSASLHNRASLMAQAALRAHLTPPSKTGAVDISGALQIGKKLDRHWAIYVFAVPKELVRVVTPPPPPPPSHK